MKSLRKSTSLGTAALIMAVAAGPALHAANQEGSSSKPVVAAQNKAGQSADDIIGQDVRSTAGQDLGEVQDLVVNTRDGRIVYALISTGGFLGIGDTVHVVPFSAFQSGQVSNNALTVDLHGQDWKSAPTVRGDQIASLTGEQRGADIYRYYSRDWDKELPKSAANSKAMSDMLWRVSDLTGKEVRNNGQEVGDIEDVIVNFDQRRASALIDPNDDYTGTDKKFAVSFDQLTPSATDKDVLMTKLTRAEFEKATPMPEDWTTAYGSTPYVWGYGAGYTAPTVAAGGAPTLHDRAAISEVRRALRNDNSIGEAAKDLRITRRGDQLVLQGSVRSEDLKNKIEEKAENVATGWDVENKLSVRSAAE